MALSAYHQSYADLSDEEIQKRLDEKEAELQKIAQEVSFDAMGESIRVAVLGCGDKRFVKSHEKIFEKVVGRSVKVTTFDIDSEHLEGEDRVVRHDCTEAILGNPFDIVYAHVLLRFIETEKQWNVIQNSYDALQSGGRAIHVLDEEDYVTEDVSLKNGLYAVPLGRWKKKLDDLNIWYKEIPVRYGLALVLMKER